jgi:hypothetical protein
MKIIIVLLFVFIGLASCQNRTARPKQESKPAPASLNTRIGNKLLQVDDTTHYAAAFIRQLREVSSEYDTLKVVGDSLFLWYRPVQKPDSTVRHSYWIPTNLELNLEIAFSSSREGKNYLLTLKRTNYTDLSYQLSQDGNPVKNGVVSLQGSFFFGAEGESGEQGPIFLHQYIDQSNGGTIIKVEIKEARLATITYTINGKDYIDLGLMKRN